MHRRSLCWAAGLVATGIGFAIFCWWGAFTVAGRRRFDEMDGIYPLAAGLLAAILFVGAAAVVALAWFGARRRRGK